MTDTQPAPTVPDEAVEAVLSRFSVVSLDPDPELDATERWRTILAAAAPFIVAANQPEVDGDLRETMRDALGKMFASNNERDAFLSRLAPAVEAHHAALLAEVERLRAQRDAALAIHLRVVQRYGMNPTGVDPDSDWVTCMHCAGPWPCKTAIALAGDATP